MTKTSLTILCALSLLAGSAFANTATKIDPSCRTDVNDPSDQGFRFTELSNLYAGQCINGNRFRPVLNLNVDAAANRTATFNNYLKENKFWKAQVPLATGAVDKVFFQIQRFPVAEGVIAAHTEIRFVFKNKNAVQLSNSNGTSTEDDLLISFEAAFPEGVSYNFALGAFKNFGLVARVLATRQKQSDDPVNVLEQYELNLTDLEKVQLLEMGLRYAQTLSIQGFYNTLRPNCTTAVFDLIDTLPRFKDKLPNFLTVISPDPIAGPSIKGLLDRALISVRSQNFNDELKGIFATYPLPKAENSFSNFLPDVEGKPWSLVTVLPDLSNYSEADQKVILELREELILAIPTLVQNYGAAMMLTKKAETGNSLFINALKEFVSRAPALLRKMNSRLPEKAAKIVVYFSPYESARGSTSLLNLGVPAQIPFSVNDQELDEYDYSSYKVFSDIYQGVGLAGSIGLKNSPKAYLTGAAIVLHAQKDYSHVTTQIAAGLNKMETAMVSETPQVRIEKVIVPNRNRAGKRPTVLVTHSQDVNQEKINETVKMEFGPFGGIGEEGSQHGFGSLEISKGNLYCDEQRELSPYFAGKLNETVVGFGPVDGFLKGKKINFYLTALRLNLKTKNIEDMNLSVSALGFNCISHGDVNKQFTESANKSLADLLNKANENPLLKALSPLLN